MVLFILRQLATLLWQEVRKWANLHKNCKWGDAYSNRGCQGVFGSTEHESDDRFILWQLANLFWQEVRKWAHLHKPLNGVLIVQKGGIERFPDMLDIIQSSFLFYDSWQPCYDKRWENEGICIKTVNEVMLIKTRVARGFPKPLNTNPTSASFYDSWQTCSDKR